MRCPRCGGDNPERAERCYLCEYPFAASAGMAEPPSPDEALRAQYPPPPPPGGQAVPPPPITGQGGYQPPPPGAYPGGYQPLPPGAYPGGYQPPPPVPGSSPTVKIIIGALVLVLIVILGVGGYFFLRGKNYSIEVPAPPGYTEANEKMLDETRESMQQQESDVALDGMYISDDGTSSIVVIHQKFFLEETPPEDPGDAERYYMENKDEILGQSLGTDLEDLGFAGDLEIARYETLRLNTGDTALLISMEMSFLDLSIALDMLIVSKGKTMFMVMIDSMGGQTTENTVEFLRENITFRE